MTLLATVDCDIEECDQEIKVRSMHVVDDLREAGWSVKGSPSAHAHTHDVDIYSAVTTCPYHKLKGEGKDQTEE